jgi:hypothetical protein
MALLPENYFVSRMDQIGLRCKSGRWMEEVEGCPVLAVSYMTFPPEDKSCRLWDNVEKYGTARQAIDQRSPTIRTSRTTKLTILNPADH